MEIDPNILVDITNIKSLCRSCLTTSETMYSLTDYVPVVNNDKNERTTVQIMLNSVTLQKVITDDKYPNKLCQMCLSLLKLSYHFRLVFERSQNVLVEILGTGNSNSGVTVVESSTATVAPVELILGEAKYDLNDVLIVEEKEDEQDVSYASFLKNLGSEVSASFVNNNSAAKRPNNSNNSINTAISKGNADENEIFSLSTNRHDNNNKTLLPQRNTSFICTICGHVSVSKSSRYHHNLIHGGKRYKCNQCPKSYYTATNLKVHTDVHRNQRKYLCNICGKRFNYQNALIYHNRTHSGEKRYVCDVCGLSFAMSCTLKRHLLTHTQHRSYPCGYCDKRFRSSNEVACHRMIHTGVRPCRCQYCGKGFTKMFNLEKHLMSHSGAHSCHVCTNRSFADVKCLRKHLHQAHNFIAP